MSPTSRLKLVPDARLHVMELVPDKILQLDLERSHPIVKGLVNELTSRGDCVPITLFHLAGQIVL